MQQLQKYNKECLYEQGEWKADERAEIHRNHNIKYPKRNDTAIPRSWGAINEPGHGLPHTIEESRPLGHGLKRRCYRNARTPRYHISQPRPPLVPCPPLELDDNVTPSIALSPTTCSNRHYCNSHTPKPLRNVDANTTPSTSRSRGHAHRHGQTKIPTKIGIKNSMAHTPPPTRLRSDDPLHGQSFPLPPQSFLSNTLVLHPGPSYPITSTRPYKTAEMPNAKSRLSPESFQMKFPFSLFCLFTITHNNNPDLCTLPYPYIIIPSSSSLSFSYSHHHSPFCSLWFPVLLCEGTHGNELRPFPIF
jgi:hypothetical protein